MLSPLPTTTTTIAAVVTRTKNIQYSDERLQEVYIKGNCKRRAQATTTKLGNVVIPKFGSKLLRGSRVKLKNVRTAEIDYEPFKKKKPTKNSSAS